MELRSIIQYRVDTILWTLSDTLTPLISLAIWYTVALSGQQVFSAREVLTYYVMIMFVTFFTAAWNGHFFAQEILTGTLAQYLVRPISIFWKHIINNITEKIIKLTLPAALLLIFLFISPETFSPAIYNPTNILFFAISLALALVISFILDMALGSIAFWMEDVTEIRRYRYLLDAVASGVLIPYAFLPPAAQTAFMFLPFRYTLAAPVEILLGRITGPGALETIVIQCGWIIGLLILLRTSWKQGIKRYAVPSQ